MRVIKKTLTYDDFISRIPGIIPSIKDSWTLPPCYNRCNEEIVPKTFFDYNEAVKEAEQYNVKSSELIYNGVFVNIADEFKYNDYGNYGLIPSDIILPKLKDEDNKDVIITDYTDLYVNLPISYDKLDDDRYNTYYDLSYPVESTDPHYAFNENTGRFGIYSGDSNTEIQILTYKTLSEWYFFAKKREKILTSPSNKMVYSDYVEYNDVEELNKRDYYYSLEQLYISRGGNYMYKWMKDNCFVTFIIPSEFSEEWNTDFLYYTQAIKWLKWFEERVELYYDSESESDKDCKKTDNCYDCNEYIRLGGHKFYEVIKEWVEKENSFEINNTNSASLCFHINLQTSIDDLGEMSILSSRWQNEVDYHNTLLGTYYFDDDSSSGGTIVYLPYKTDNETGKISYIYDTAMISGDSVGYSYNDFYENVFNEGDWISAYTDYYVNHNVEEFASNYISAYTYSPVYDRIVYNPEENPDMFKKYITPTLMEFILINDNMYEVINGKYVNMCYTDPSIANLKFKNGSKLRIYKDGDLEYAILDGKKFYVETVEEDGEEIEKVFFLKNYTCKDEGCPVTNAEYVMYNNILYLVENDSVKISDEIDEYIYYTFDGVFEVDGITYYLKKYGDEYKIVTQQARALDDGETIEYEMVVIEPTNINDSNIKSLSCVIDSYGNPVIIAEYNYNIKFFNKITGYTDSKLELLRRKEITTDDLGNELPGYFRTVIDDSSIEAEYGRPDSDSYYDNKAGEEQYYNNPYDGCLLDILYRVGEVSNLKHDDYLGESFFVGNIIESIEFYYVDTDFKRIEGLTSSFAMDDDALSKISECEEARLNYTGDTIIYDKMMCDITYHFGAVLGINQQDRTKYEIITDYHTGIKYVDTMFVTLSTCPYITSDGTKFMVKYYKLTPFKESIHNQTENMNSQLMMTKFEVEPMLFYYDKDKVLKKPNYYLFNRWEGDYNFVESPVFREEYNIGNATPQIIEGNIYIDRGINSAFERHLKLQEIRTMEALNNYGNNWFKIINNG